MSGVRRGPFFIARLTLFLAAGTAALCLAGPARAQETADLRGEVTEDQTTRQLFTALPQRRPAAEEEPNDTGIPAPAYEAVSAGALPLPSDRPATDSIFAQPEEEDALDFGAAAAPSARTPSTARERRAQPERSAAARPASAAERLDAEREARAALDETPTGTTPAPTVDEELDLTVDPGAERAGAIEGLERTPEEDPYAALGIRAGSFILKPSLETGIGWNSNPNYSPEGSGAVLSETTLRLNAASDWSRHAATLDAYGTYRKSLSGEEVDEPRAGLDGTLRLDLIDDYTVLGTIGYAIGPESASSPTTIVGAVERPIRQTITGSLGLQRDVGKFQFRLTARGEREMYGDADLEAGGTLSQRDRNSNLGTFVLRGGYEISPALTPFVEVEAGRRIYDEDLDSSGYERSTTRLGARAGLALDLGEKLSGELAAGWIEEKFDDGRLAAISAATVDASLAWSPLRGTLVNLNGSTTVEGATTAGESGSVLYSAGIAVERQLLDNLTGTVGLGAAYRDYVGLDGHDLTWNAELGLTYWFNRYAGLTGRARHESQTSSIAGRGYDAQSVFLGVKFQR
jgi:hypothetical protein